MRIDKILLAGLAAAVLINPTWGVARAATKISLKVSPAEAAIVLHQPLDVVLNFHNFAAQTAEFDFGDDRKTNIVLTVTYPDGTRLTHGLLPHEGLAQMGLIKIPGDGTFSQHLIVNEWVEFKSIGRYTIFFSLRGRAKLTDGTSADVPSAGIDVIVEGSNNKVLAGVCDDLVKEVLSSRTYDGARLPAEALSYVNDPVAIPYLQRAFDTPYPIQSLLADALEKIGTDDSIRALLAVSRSKPDVARDAVKQALANLIIRTSDPELKKEISEALKDRT